MQGLGYGYERRRRSDAKNELRYLCVGGYDKFLHS